jgi:hypothetical protein
MCIRTGVKEDWVWVLGLAMRTGGFADWSEIRRGMRTGVQRLGKGVV